jgi:hypothetical protein
MHKRPIDVGVVFVLNSPDKIKVSKHSNWKLAGSNFTVKVSKELKRARMIRWPIHPNKLKFKLGLSVEQCGTQKEGPLINRTHLKGIITNTQQHPP